MDKKEIKRFYRGKTVAVTGAAGFIGHHLVKELVSYGCQVRAMVKYNSQSNIGLLQTLNLSTLKRVEMVFGNVCDLRMMERFVQDTDVVFHLAALIGIPYSYVSPKDYIEVNTLGALNILEAVRRFKTPRLVVTSTSETYGSAQYVPMDEKHPLQAQSPYSASKIAADQLALSYYRSFNTPVAIIRPFNVFGPRQSLRAVIPTIVQQMLKYKSAITVGSRFPVRDFTYVTDVVDGFVRLGCANNVEGNVFNIATGVGVSIDDIIKSSSALIGYKGKVVSKKERKRPEKSEVIKLIGSAKKAREHLGWIPKVSFEEGLKKVIEDFKKSKFKRDVSRYAI
jgi:NAD dependent epimerase/dehydratase